jgi:sporulation protein YlmC with PRC-barrel domain
MDSAQGGDVMRLSDLRDKRVKTLDGNTLGRVHEIHCDDGRVTALMCGASSFIERLTAKQHGRRVPWDRVIRVDEDAVVIGPAKEASAARSRRGIRRPSAQRSKR